MKRATTAQASPAKRPRRGEPEAKAATSSAALRILAGLGGLGQRKPENIVVTAPPRREGAYSLLIGGSTTFGGETDSFLASPHRLVFPSKTIVRVVAASAASHHALIVCDGAVHAFGRNDAGQLGAGDTDPRAGVVRVFEGDVIDAACGRFHSVLVKRDGSVLAAGMSERGAAPSRNNGRFTAVRDAPITTRAVAGLDFTLLLDNEQNVWSFGYSQYGVLGHGADEAYIGEGAAKLLYVAHSRPEKVEGLKEIVQVACGSKHCCALDSRGTVFTWGCGELGALGHKGAKDTFSPKAVEVNACLPQAFSMIACGNSLTALVPISGKGLLLCGRVPTGNEEWITPREQSELQGCEITALSCGGRSVHIISPEGGGVISWGKDCVKGELGLLDCVTSAKPERVQPAAQRAHTIAAARGFTIWTSEIVSPKDVPAWEPPSMAESKPVKEQKSAGAAKSGKGGAAKSNATKNVKKDVGPTAKSGKGGAAKSNATKNVKKDVGPTAKTSQKPTRPKLDPRGTKY